MYLADATRYDGMDYPRCGRSGLRLPRISLGLWQNFGGVDVFETGRALIRRAFDRGVTHFDLANNYGPPYGSAEESFGRIFAADLAPYRDEMVISTKAGWDMWAGPLRPRRLAKAPDCLTGPEHATDGSRRSGSIGDLEIGRALYESDLRRLAAIREAGALVAP